MVKHIVDFFSEHPPEPPAPFCELDLSEEFQEYWAAD